MRQYFSILKVVTLLFITSAATAEETYDYEVTTVTRCGDGVVMQEQFFSDDQSTGTTAIRLPDADEILYGAFELGHIVEFGYLDEPPIYNEDVSFDWGDWVDQELQAHGYKPWFDGSPHAKVESCDSKVV